jgi:ATP:corrinoid adenosyltransferase
MIVVFTGNGKGKTKRLLNGSLFIFDRVIAVCYNNDVKLE